MKWHQWLLFAIAVWYIQEHNNAALTGIYILGILGFVGYLNISHRLKYIESQITKRTPIDLE